VVPSSLIGYAIILLQNSPQSETLLKFETLFFLPAVNIFMSYLFSLKFSLCLWLSSHLLCHFPICPESHLHRLTFRVCSKSLLFRFIFLICLESISCWQHWSCLTCSFTLVLQFDTSFGTDFCLGCSLASIFGQFSIVSYSRCDLTLSILRSKIYYLVVFQFQSGHLLVYFSFRRSIRQDENISIFWNHLRVP